MQRKSRSSSGPFWQRMFADRTTNESQDRSRMNSGERPVERTMFIKELWRYPAKSMAGEQLNATQVGKLGMAGDRKVLVLGPNGRVITSRTHHKLLGLKGTLGADGNPSISGHVWNTPE